MTPLRVIALDGADHRVLSSLLDAGRLPVLDAFRRRGATIRCRTIGGLFEESVWPSVFTGEPLGDTGAHHFVTFDPGTYELGIEREVPDLEPFWMHLPDRGRGALAVEVPQIHPVAGSEADESCCWSTWSPPHRPTFHPRSLRRDLGRSPTHGQLTEFTRAPTIEDERRFSRRCIVSAGAHLRAVSRAGRDRRLVCTGIAELHGVAHMLGHHWLDDHPHHPWPREPKLVTDVYEAMDASMAALIDEPAANVAVIASQGFRPANSSAELLPELLERAGLASPPATDGEPRRDAMSLLRRWLPAGLRERVAVRFLPLPAQERLMSRQFQTHLDWSRTRVFALPTWTTGYLRVNLAGREAMGIVPPSEYEPLLDEVERLLLEVEVEPGRPLVARVHRMRRSHPGRHAEALPDLAVEWAQDVPVDRACHPALGTWTAENPYHRFRWSDHHGEAVAYLAGPDVRAVDGAVDADIHGATPTFLRLLGVRPPAHLREAWDEVLA